MTTKGLGLPLNVYVSANGDDFSNNGVSSQHTRLTLVGTLRHGQAEVQPLDKGSQVFAPLPDAPAVVLVESNVPALYGPHLVPLEFIGKSNTAQHAGPMFGGNYAAASDSRVTELARTVFGHSQTGVFPIHDRVESWATYEALSR